MAVHTSWPSTKYGKLEAKLIKLDESFFSLLKAVTIPISGSNIHKSSIIT